MRLTANDPEEMIIYWTAWVYITFFSSCCSLFVIAFVCSSRRLMANYQNRFIVGLAIPDMVFSGLCGITCFNNMNNGIFFGGAKKVGPRTFAHFVSWTFTSVSCKSVRNSIPSLSSI